MPMVQTFEEPKEKPATTRTRKAAPKKEPKKREPKKREPKRAALPKPSEIIEEVNKAGEAVIPTDKDAGSAVISDAVTRLRQQALATYRTVATAEEMRYLVLNDLFYLLVVIMGRADMNSDFCFMRCAEVQASPNEHIDLWAREHYKSTIITVGKTIQDILRDPELTVVIFSHTRPNAKAFLRQIMRELELNKTLFNLFPDILYNDPRKEARQWSEETGILLKRRTNPKENTVEAWGVVDGQPTGKHFALMVYDDIVTKESVSTPEMIRKTTEAWELSLNLSARGGHIRYIGTRYHANDTYDTLLKREAGKPRIYPATVDGTPTGAPVLLPANLLMEKARLMGSYTFACHGAGSLVLMADWTQKPIEDVRVGDMVIGWTLPSKKYGRCKVKPVRVLASSIRVREALESTLEDGTTHVHTPDHKWWTGRVDGVHSSYAPLSMASGPGSVKSLIRMNCIPSEESLTDEQRVAVGYLAAMLDGEGALGHNVINITQDALLHPHVCERIEWCLNTLSIPFSIFERPEATQRMYTLTGGCRTKARLSLLLRGVLGKLPDLLRQSYSMKIPGRKQRVACVAQKSVGMVNVYNIQTETGNYVVDGILSKNCQMLQNPLSDKANGFDLAWLRYWSGKPAKGERDEMGRPKTDHTLTMNRYLLVDPANAKKKHSDYTAMWVIGLAQDGNYYVIDGVRDRLNLSQRWEKLYALHKKHRPQAVGYERYGVQTDIDYFREKMDFHNYHFDIVELGGSTAKSDRIRKLAPVFQSGRFFLPYRIPYVTVEGEQTELVTTFIDEEYNTFPIGAHDDSLDCMSRILDTDLAVSFPELFGDDEEDEEVFGDEHVHTFDPLARWRDNKRAEKTLSTLRFQ